MNWQELSRQLPKAEGDYLLKLTVNPAEGFMVHWWCTWVRRLATTSNNPPNSGTPILLILLL
jgi:hypothetical protein